MTVTVKLTLDDATVVHDDRNERYLFLAGIVVLVYDHLLTFGAEVTYIWTKGIRRSSGWYFFVRYFALLANMGSFALAFGDFDSEVHGHFTDAYRCAKLNDAHGIVIVVQQLFVGSTLVLRVLAMYSFDKRITVTLITAVIVVLGVAAYCLSTGPPARVETTVPGCHIGAPWSVRLRESQSSPSPITSQITANQGLAAAWEAQLAGDVLLLAFTLCHGYSRRRSEVFLYGRLWRVLVRDGAMYFGMICLANLANILMYNLGDVGTLPSTSSHPLLSMSSFTVALSVTMICRVMLNLHEAGSIRSTDSTIRLDTLRFAHTEEESSVAILHQTRAQSVAGLPHIAILQRAPPIATPQNAGLQRMSQSAGLPRTRAQIQSPDDEYIAAVKRTPPILDEEAGG
ncbi:hypothetical protein C8R44DRAFT_983278, partial [Mycena epipterygia]